MPDPKTIQNITVLGGGSAGFLAALTLKRKLPHLAVTVLRSPDIGVIGVGEGTVPLFPNYFFNDLRLKPAQFYAEAAPTWKLGIRFIWGKRKHFHYTFSKMIDARWPELPRMHGFYCDDDFENLDLWSSLMGHDRAFPRGSDGNPNLFGHEAIGFHIENDKLVTYLEARCRDFGVVIRDCKVSSVIKGGDGIQALVLDTGEQVTGDLFLDASGFRSELIGRAFEESFVSYDDTLFCDRAVIGGWARTTEPIKSYTTCETMNAGWAWQIEHETWINRGYVYSSRFISDDEALAELMRKNPQISNTPRVVRFRTGRYRRMWIGNVVGIGNASGFVEPLEATALQVIILQCRALVETLQDSLFSPTNTVVNVYNSFISQAWDDVRDFLAVHYRFNERIDTPFWETARNEVALHGAEPIVEYYKENGPSALGRTILIGQNNPFGLEGYLAMLVGQQVPHGKPYAAPAKERKIFEDHRRTYVATAERAFNVRQTLEAIRKPGWKWD